MIILVRVRAESILISHIGAHAFPHATYLGGAVRQHGSVPEKVIFRQKVALLTPFITRINGLVGHSGHSYREHEATGHASQGYNKLVQHLTHQTEFCIMNEQLRGSAMDSKS